MNLVGPVAGLRAALRRVPAEAWIVLGVLLVQQAVLLGGYWSGAVTPPWDFYGSYNTEAFAWWHDGGFFDPPEWVPYLWGGYPAAASIQNSSWYLPVGVVAEAMPFTIHAAAIVAALHVALGSMGAYVLVRRWVGGGAPAILALVAYTFATPFFSNAQHVDVVRAAAWLPWVVLIASPRWPWRRWWAVPLAGLLVWQFAVGAYAGVVVIAAYAIVVGVIAWQVTERPRPRDFLVPLAVTGLVALGLSLVKYLPNLLVRGVPVPGQPSPRIYSRGLLGTLFFGQDVEFLDFYDLTMRSLFVVAPVLLLLAFVPLRSAAARVALAMAVVPVLVGFPALPWFDLVGDLPGLGLSRFRFMDARTVAVVPVVVLGSLGLARLLRGPTHRARRLALAAVPALAVWIAATTPFVADQWLVPMVVLGLAAGAIVLAARTPLRAGAAAVLVVLAGVSGVDWAHDAPQTWRTDRVETEIAHWGEGAATLIAARQGVTGPQRPGRTPPDPLGRDAWSPVWVSAYYTGRPVVAGKSALKGNESFEALFAAVQDPERTWEGEFFAAPGVLATPEVAADAGALARCAADGSCGPGLAVVPTGYTPGEHGYGVVAATDSVVWFNEAHYRGWTLTACAEECRDLPVSATDVGAVTATIPAGTWDLTLRYRTPGQAAGWWSFAAGVVLAAAYPAVGSVRRTRARNSS